MTVTTISEPTQTITIELPQSVVQYLAQIGQRTQQSVTELAEQTIQGNLPPSVEHAPLEIQAVDAQKGIRLGLITLAGPPVKGLKGFIRLNLTNVRVF